jgi:RND family efflux transporter MFP subunit
VTVGIPEQLITRIEPGQTVQVRFDALPGPVFPAKVTEVGVAPLPGGATFPVTARLEDAAERVRPGMAATVTFHFEQTPAVGGLLVPAVAVSEDRRGRFVFVVEPLEPGVGIVRRREVSVGELTSGGMIVREGLSGGEAVVTAGISRIEEGMKVAIPEEDDAP